jgi:hypothetical protein
MEDFPHPEGPAMTSRGVDDNRATHAATSVVRPKKLS